MEYSDNAMSVFKKLYFAEKEDHPDQVFERVADVVSKGCPDPDKRSEYKENFFKIMSNGYFRPNSPAMINCGCQENPQTAACFVGKQEDDLKSILDFDREAALVFASGSGIGINYGQLREAGAVLSSGGDSSGPFAFMKKLAATGDAVKSGGRSRRSAIMSMMFDHHPDLLDFITIKNGSDQSLRSMNLSVAISDDFMNAVKNDELWRLVGVVDGKTKKELPARDVFDKIARNAHKTGDPGVWFIDRANRDNGLFDVSGPYLSTNPCGEQSLHKQGSCCLGSINLTKFFDKDTKGFRYMEFQEVIRTATCFLDFMISVSGYPTEDYKIVAEKTRPIGLGIMGLADLLCLMKLPYDGAEAREFTHNIFKKLTQESIMASIDLGHEYGSFPAFKDAANKMNQLVDSFMPLDEEIDAIRNSQWTTVAPTGSISISADCSPGMEPLFGICYTKRLSDSDEKWIFVNPIFEKKYKEASWYQEGIEKIAENHGACQGIECIPKEIQKVWKVAHDIGWKDRLLMQSKIQEYVSNAISSTVNLPEKATVEEIKGVYTCAYDLDLKGVTVYRDGCLQNQPVAFGEEKGKTEPVKKLKTRPKILVGNSHLIQTGHGKVYLTVNRDGQNNVFEMFTNGGKNGGVSAANLEAIARLASLALQEGVTVDKIATTLARINDGTCVWDKLHENDSRAQQIISIPDAISQVLKRFYCNGKNPKDQEAALKSSYCPDCGSEIFLKEGCSFCPECGSKCG